MTVAELIELLEDIPGDLPVVMESLQGDEVESVSVEYDTCFLSSESKE